MKRGGDDAKAYSRNSKLAIPDGFEGPPCPAEPVSSQLHKPRQDYMIDSAISVSVSEYACAGYCSLVHFAEGDLGTPLAADKVPAHIQPLMKAAAKAAAPATPEQLAPAKAPRKTQPQGRADSTAKPEQALSAQGMTLQAVSTSDQEPKQAAALAGPLGRPDAREQHSGEHENAGSQPAQVELTAAAQERPSQASAPLPEPEQPSAQKRPMTEARLGQPEQTEMGQAGSAVKKQKRIVPTAMATAFSAPSTARSGEATHRLFLLNVSLVVRMSVPRYCLQHVCPITCQGERSCEV